MGQSAAPLFQSRGNGKVRFHLNPRFVLSALLGVVWLGGATQAMAAGPLISAGGSFVMATASNGKLYAWGQNDSGELGNGIVTRRNSTLVAVNLPAAVTAKAVAAGENFSLAIGSDGKLYSWGGDNFGQLGNRATKDSSIPAAVSLPIGVTPEAMAAGDYFSLVIGSNGKLYALGDNTVGQEGNGTTNGSSAPVVVNLPSGVKPTAIAAGGAHGLAIGSDGKLYAWGDNNYGQLGNGATKDSSTPVVVNLPSGVIPEAAAAGDDFSLAIGSDGKLYAWGKNYNSELGNGTTKDSSTPVVVNLPSGIKPTVVAAGGAHSLAIGSDGKLYAWGMNRSGELGNGSLNNRSTPSVVSLPPGVRPKAVAAGDNSSLAIGSDGKLYAWGFINVGKRGSSTTTPSYTTPIVVSFMEHISQLLPPGYAPKPITLAATIKPITRAYPGVDASILGIRTGMTISQVEAIATKRGLGRPEENKTQLSTTFTNFMTQSGSYLTVWSKEYVASVGYMRGAVNVSFSSPAGGDRSDAISLHAVYSSNPKRDPFTMNALARKLLHKYGPPSYQLHGPSIRGGDWYLWWDFGKQSLLQTCNKKIACFPYPGEFNFSSILTYDTRRSKEIQPDFYIVALIQPNVSDRAKAGELHLSLGDVEFATLDRDEAMKKLRLVGANDAANPNQSMAAEAMKAKATKAKKKLERRKAQLKLVPKF